MTKCERKIKLLKNRVISVEPARWDVILIKKPKLQHFSWYWHLGQTRFHPQMEQLFAKLNLEDFCHLSFYKLQLFMGLSALKPGLDWRKQKPPAELLKLSLRGVGVVVGFPGDGGGWVDKCEFSELGFFRAAITLLWSCDLAERGFCGLFWVGSRSSSHRYGKVWRMVPNQKPQVANSTGLRFNKFKPSGLIPLILKALVLDFN